MLTVNLLPESARKSGPSPLDEVHRTPLFLIVVATMAILPVLLFMPIRLRRQQLQQLNAKIELVKPKRAEVDRIQTVLRQLRAQEASFKGLGKEQQLWAKRLNILSNLTPDGVWFTELSLDQAKELVIQGSAIGLGGAETGSVGRLVQDLKGNTDFSSAAKDIQIESIKRRVDGQIELVDFTLRCALIVASKP